MFCSAGSARGQTRAVMRAACRPRRVLPAPGGAADAGQLISVQGRLVPPASRGPHADAPTAPREGCRGPEPRGARRGRAGSAGCTRGRTHSVHGVSREGSLPLRRPHPAPASSRCTLTVLHSPVRDPSQAGQPLLVTRPHCATDRALVSCPSPGVPSLPTRPTTCTRSPTVNKGYCC